MSYVKVWFSRETHQRIHHEEALVVVREEWQRAKKLIPKYLRRFPTMWWGEWKVMKHSYGRAAKYGHYVVMHSAYRRHWGEPGIEDHFRQVLRHEFAHLCPSKSHDKEFLRWMTILGATRFAPRAPWEANQKTPIEGAF